MYKIKIYTPYLLDNFYLEVLSNNKLVALFSASSLTEVIIKYKNWRNLYP